MTDKDLHISERLSYPEIETTYKEKVLKQDFYNVEYAKEWEAQESPARDMARYIKDVFNPKTVLDVGCGIGKLVYELRKLGIDAKGVEFSDAFIRLSPVGEHIFRGDLLSLPSVITQKYDVVLCMEVLEHIPPTQLDHAIENLKSACGKTIVLTMPSFGPDFHFVGLPLNEPCWLQDAKDNVPFRNLVVDADNVPDLGHISLATFRWWSDKLLLNGLIRVPLLELAGYRDFDFLKYRWNVYVLQQLAEDSVAIQNGNFYTVGLFDAEDWGSNNGYVRWTEPTFDIYLRLSKQSKHIILEFYSGPRELVYSRELCVTVEVLKEEDLKISYVRLNTEAVCVDPGEWCRAHLDGEYKTGDVIRLHCSVNRGFVPHYILRNGDMRNLGVAIRSVRVS